MFPNIVTYLPSSKHSTLIMANGCLFYLEARRHVTRVSELLVSRLRNYKIWFEIEKAI